MIIVLWGKGPFLLKFVELSINCNTEEREGDPVKHFYTVFLLLMIIKFLTENVTWGGLMHLV